MRAKRATLIFTLVSKWRQIKKLYHFFWLAFLPIWCPLKGEPRPPWIIGGDFGGQIKQILVVIIHVAYCHDYHSTKKGLSWFMVLAWLQYCGLYQGQIRLCFFLTSSVTTSLATLLLLWLYFCILHEQSAEDTQDTPARLLWLLFKHVSRPNLWPSTKRPCLMHLKKVWWAATDIL